MKLKQIPIKKMDKKMSDSIESPGSYPPSFYVNDKQMPEIRNWKVGEKYQITIEVEMKSFRDEAIADKPNKVDASASFDILAYSPDMDYENMDDKDLETLQAKALSNK